MMKKRIVCLLAILSLMCSICLPAYTQGAEFDYVEDESRGGIRLSNYRGPGGEIVIPAEYDGKKVIAVDYLGGSKSITKVTIPEGVKEIVRTFKNMTALKEVVLPHSLLQVGFESFNNTGLTEVNFPEGVEEFVISSIINNMKLQSISVPASCRWFHVAAFENNPALRSFSISPQNPNWTTTANGALLMRKSDRNVFACAGAAIPKTFTVPNEVSSLRSNSLDGCPNLETLILPSHIGFLDGDAVRNCPKIKTVYAKAESFQIPPYAFSDIKGQVTVYCNLDPNVERWDNFTIKPYIDGMENAAVAPQPPASTKASSNTKTPTADVTQKSDLKPTVKTDLSTSTAPVSDITMSEVTTEPLTQTATEPTTAATEPNGAVQDNSEKPNNLGWIIGGAVGGVILTAGAVLIVLKKKGKLPVKKS